MGFTLPDICSIPSTSFYQEPAIFLALRNIAALDLQWNFYLYYYILSILFYYEPNYVPPPNTHMLKLNHHVTVSRDKASQEVTTVK